MNFLLRQPPSGVAIVGENEGDSIFWEVASQSWRTGPGGGGGAVSSVFGRTGAVVAETGDYDSDQIDNVSTVPGASVSDALEAVAADATLALQRGLVAYLRLANATLGVVVETLATPNTMLAATALDTDFAVFDDGRFTLGANGVLTYTGPTVQVLARQIVCLFSSSVVAVVFGATAHNADLVGQPATEIGSTLIDAGAGWQTGGAGDFSWQLVSSRLLTLASGDTLQPVVGYAPSAGGSNMVVTFCELEVLQVGNLS